MHVIYVVSGRCYLMTLVYLSPLTGVSNATLTSACHHSCMLMQNPKERITLGKMMKHPWVTRRGSWPLRTVKEMVRVGETPELPPVLPDLMSTLNVLDIPRQVQHTPLPPPPPASLAQGGAGAQAEKQLSISQLRCYLTSSDALVSLSLRQTHGRGCASGPPHMFYCTTYTPKCMV